MQGIVPPWRNAALTCQVQTRAIGTLLLMLKVVGFPRSNHGALANHAFGPDKPMEFNATVYESISPTLERSPAPDKLPEAASAVERDVAFGDLLRNAPGFA